MQRFRQMRCLQKFASVHASVHNHFNLERSLLPHRIQAEPCCRPRRVARPFRGLTDQLACPSRDGVIGLRVARLMTVVTKSFRLLRIV